MRRSRILAATVVLSAAISLSTVAPASAHHAVEGTWYHNITVTQVWSNYYHGLKVHKSSVTTSYGYDTSGWQPRQVWAYSGLQASVTGNKANYDFK